MSAPLRAGQTVRYVGLHGTANGPTGRVWRVTTRGVWVTLPGPRRECWHPDDVAPVEPPQPPPAPHTAPQPQQQ